MTDEATIQDGQEQIRRDALDKMDYGELIDECMRLFQAYDKLKEDFEDETIDKEYFQQQWYEGKTRIAELEAQLQAKEPCAHRDRDRMTNICKDCGDVQP